MILDLPLAPTCAKASACLFGSSTLLARALMGLDLVEIQQTDRYFVFGAPATSCKVNWPGTQTKAPNPSQASVSGAAARSAPKSTTSAAAEMASEGSAASAVSVGARKVLPEDVLLVAVHCARVDLHPASLEKACPVSCKPPRGGDAAFEVRCVDLCTGNTGRRLCCGTRAGMCAAAVSISASFAHC